MADDGFGSGLSFGGVDGAPQGGDAGTDVLPGAPPAPSFGDTFRSLLPGPQYKAPDPAASPLDQTADLLQQRITRANEIATNPIKQFFNPEGVQAARNFVPQATEQLQKIRQQKAAMQANRQQAETLGLAPGEVPDEASMADRVVVAQAKALKGDLRVFQGLATVDPKAAEAIQDRVYQAGAAHLDNAQQAYDVLSGATGEAMYQTALKQLRASGKLEGLEALGLKVPPSHDAFQGLKAAEGEALRNARIGLNTIRQKLEERNTYQPMEEKEAKTYNGRLTTAYGDQITNGTWSRNAAMGTRGLVVNGAADPRELGKTFTLASPEQRKAIKEEFDGAVPKEQLEKYREFNRTYKLATEDAKGNKVADGKINTNPNVQQGIAEGLAAMLRGGTGGANVGLLKIELAKRGWAQGAIDGLVSNYNGTLNTLFANANKPYLTEATQRQIRDVMDVLKTYNDSSMSDRVSQVAQRAGALGLEPSVLGLGKGEASGAIHDAMEAGRMAQIQRMMPGHRAIGGGDGVFQLGAQVPGADAAPLPGGTTPTTQIPGAPPLRTPVQQAMQPGVPSPVAPSGTPGTPGGASPPAGSPPASPGPAGGGSPVTVAGQQVAAALPAGASPELPRTMQRIETPNAKDPWTATTGKGPDGKPLSTASGAYQMLDSTWMANRPPGATATRAKDATPEQQTAAYANLTQRNAAALTAAKLPVNDTTLYIAHNLGEGAGPKLLQADPNADARAVVGEAAARNNPKFFKGRPTVATVLQRYQDAIAEASKPGDDGTPAPKAPGSDNIWIRAADALSNPKQLLQDTKEAAINNAPAIGSTAGAIGGGVLGSFIPGAGTAAGAVGGGAVGGGAGQMLKDYLQGNVQSPREIAKQTALGGILGVMPAGRPVVGAAARVVGGGAVEAGDAAVKGEEGADILNAGVKGAAESAGGEMFGRALGMVGHKVFTMFSPDAQKTVQAAAKKFSEADEVLKTEAPKLPGANGGTVDNPKYAAAEKARDEAERTLKDVGLKPDEAAYAHKVSTEGVPKQEAQVARPAELEKQRIGQGYDQINKEVAETGVGAPKATPKLPDGPRAAVENKQVSAAHAELAEHVEAAITAPAPSWSAKWSQLQDARSQLLQAERDALSSTVPGRTKTAADMRKLADTVRKQQEKAAEYVFGKDLGQQVMARLRVLDTRYRNLMEAVGGDAKDIGTSLTNAAKLKGEAGREVDRKFKAFAHDDKDALAAWNAMRGVRGDIAEATVPWTVAAEGLPYIGKAVKAVKLGGILQEWARERAAGSPATFADFVKLPRDNTGKIVRDITGTAAARAAVQGDVLGQQPQE